MEQKNAQVIYKHISFYFNSDVCVFMAVLQCKGRLGTNCYPYTLMTKLTSVRLKCTLTEIITMV